jgi:uncharacterized protein (TIGR02996 family)
MKDLMEAVCRDPADDAPRLAFADWAEGNGDAARAEYIRRSLALFQKGEIEDASTLALRTPERKIAWSNGIDALGLDMYHYVRGFVASIHCDAGKFVAEADQIARRCPLQYLHLLRGAPPLLAKILPRLGNVLSLDLGRNQLGDDDVALLAQADLPDLKWLNLDRNPLTIRAVEMMAQAASRFPNLHTLHFPSSVGDIYDDIEGGTGAYPLAVTVHRPPEGARLRSRARSTPNAAWGRARETRARRWRTGIRWRRT